VIGPTWNWPCCWNCLGACSRLLEVLMMSSCFCFLQFRHNCLTSTWWFICECALWAMTHCQWPTSEEMGSRPVAPPCSHIVCPCVCCIERTCRSCIETCWVSKASWTSRCFNDHIHSFIELCLQQQVLLVMGKCGNLCPQLKTACASHLAIRHGTVQLPVKCQSAVIPEPLERKRTLHTKSMTSKQKWECRQRSRVILY